MWEKERERERATPLYFSFPNISFSQWHIYTIAILLLNTKPISTSSSFLPPIFFSLLVRVLSQMLFNLCTLITLISTLFVFSLFLVAISGGLCSEEQSCLPSLITVVSSYVFVRLWSDFCGFGLMGFHHLGLVLTGWSQVVIFISNSYRSICPLALIFCSLVGWRMLRFNACLNIQISYCVQDHILSYMLVALFILWMFVLFENPMLFCRWCF